MRAFRKRQLFGLDADERLSACLALAPDRAVYLEPEEDGVRLGRPSLNGHLVTGQLALAGACDDAGAACRTRQATLEAVIADRRRRGGFLPGDLAKGSHAANDEERQRWPAASPTAPHGG